MFKIINQLSLKIKTILNFYQSSKYFLNHFTINQKIYHQRMENIYQAFFFRPGLFFTKFIFNYMVITYLFIVSL